MNSARMSALFQPFPMLPGRRAQVWRHQPEYRRPRHFHAEPEINLVVRGSAVMGVGDQTVAMAPGEMLIFQPGQDHALLEASDDLELFVLALRPELAERARLSDWLRSIQSSTLTRAELGAMVAELGGLGDVRNPASSEERLANIFSLAVERAPKPHVYSRKALAVLISEQALSEIALARRLNASPSGVSRHFHADLGMRLVEYRSRLRLMRFVELVDAGIAVSRAALDADFGSYAQCHRVFRRLVGCSPSAYFRGARTFVDQAKV
ncbi:MAG TPA: helix-turn-helix transcriptional regulator [Polyangiaceae bacterium]|nr:helix-turn-helix transcriptional regulator [Polyangiaceae bacterium]